MAATAMSITQSVQKGGQKKGRKSKEGPLKNFCLTITLETFTTELLKILHLSQFPGLNM